MWGGRSVWQTVPKCEPLAFTNHRRRNRLRFKGKQQEWNLVVHLLFRPSPSCAE